MNPQAIVYNTKVENIPHLATLGFDLQNDIISLDPAAPNSYAWDIAADVDSRGSIKKFAELLIPKSASANQDRLYEFFSATARRVIEDIIVSLGNAGRSAGKQPLWTLRDLVKVASNEDDIKDTLRWHDNSKEVIENIFGLLPQQTSSLMMVLRLPMPRYEAIAERWSMAQEQGRTLSLKKWLNSGDRSVLVLPLEEMLAEEAMLRPLNWTILEDLTRIIFDQTKEQPPKRYFFLENMGRAAEFDGLDLLISHARSHRIEVFLDPQNPDTRATQFRPI